MQKTTTAHTTHTSSLGLLMEAFVAKMRASLNKLVPVGYQDESGFHLGVDKGRSEENRPSFQ
jgi:hypothetical protein